VSALRKLVKQETQQWEQWNP